MLGKRYISITVDDLEARDDPERSDRISVHNCTIEEAEAALEIVKNLKRRTGVRTDIVGCISPEDMRATNEAWDRNHPNGED